MGIRRRARETQSTPAVIFEFYLARCCRVCCDGTELLKYVMELRPKTFSGNETWLKPIMRALRPGAHFGTLYSVHYGSQR